MIAERPHSIETKYVEAFYFDQLTKFFRFRFQRKQVVNNGRLKHRQPVIMNRDRSVEEINRHQIVIVIVTTAIRVAVVVAINKVARNLIGNSVFSSKRLEILNKSPLKSAEFKNQTQDFFARKQNENATRPEYVKLFDV